MRTFPVHGLWRRAALFYFLQYLVGRHVPGLGAGTVGACLDALVAAAAQGGIPADGSLLRCQGMGGTDAHTRAAVAAEMDGLRVVTVFAGKSAALKKDGHTVARPVHQGGGNNAVDRR